MRILRQGGFESFGGFLRGDQRDICKVLLSDILEVACADIQLHTRDSHAVAPFKRIPDHGAISDWNQGLGEVFGAGCESVQRDAWSTENQRLETRRRHVCVRHGVESPPRSRDLLR